MRQLLVFISFLTLLNLACYCQEVESKAYSNRELAIKFVEGLNGLSSNAFSLLHSTSFKHHNLTIVDGKEAFVKHLENKIKQGLSIEIVRVIEDNDYVFVQSVYNSRKPEIVYDVFRFAEGLIVEHWENAEKINPTNSSGRSQIDGPIRIMDKEFTKRNKEIIVEFLTTLLIQKKIDKVDKYFNGDIYIQHNSNVADGLHSIKNLLYKYKRENINVGFTKIHKVIGEGNFVLTMNEGYFENDTIAYFDLFRLENGIVAEHWDVISTIPPKKYWKNRNGKF